ncbi:MAG TPA: D-alanyl-D-alanine carboxypeptidase, partial [Pseudolysinimonas sp.]|nr:D-alanyl-D-alanine carboxypeptidase [Pseudolysinimonas sp.]
MSDEQHRSRRGARAARTPRERGGIAAVLRRHPTAWSSAGIVAGFVLLAAGSLVAGMAVASPHATVSPSATPSATPRPTPSALATPSRLRTCSIASLAADPRLMTLEGSVLRADTGEVLFDRAAANPAPTASLLKVLVAAAAVSTLGPDYQIATDVVDGSAPGTVVLVGHGDATLSALGPGRESVYAGAPKLSDLAAQTVAAYASRHPGVAITEVILDASYWSSADAWDPDVKGSERTQGYQSLTTALQVDGDRADPTRQTSPRGSDPVADAGAAFVSALKAADPGGVVAGSVGTADGTATAGAAQLAQVKSQPVRALLPQMLLPSDNTLGEMLARIVSKAGGYAGSAASLQQAIPAALAPYKLPAAGLTIRDGSGESPKNAVPASTMSLLMMQVQAGSQNLDVVRDALPVAGKTGGLADRFTGSNAVARGHVTAKTG